MKRREFLGLIGGAATASPSLVWGQNASIPVIGFLHPASREGYASAIAEFLKGLAEIGYVDRKNVQIDYRFAENQYDQLSALAADLVRHQVSVIAAMTTPAVRASKSATASIPVVFVTIADPVRTGFVASLNRPGGNMTGVTLLGVEVGPKLLEVLHEVVPIATTVALLVNPTNPNVETQSRDFQAAALKLALKAHIVTAGTERDLDELFAKLQELKVNALMIGQDPFLITQTERLASLSLRHRMPAINQLRDFALAGGLLSYGASQTEAWRQVGIYVARILKGDKPADLPVMQPSKLDFVINLKTAKTLGLEIPLPLVNRADEVIE
jgi:putative ABC transport system substrate-binding protein